MVLGFNSWEDEEDWGISKEEPQRSPIGITVGRFCPLHLGHQRIIKQMINDVGPKNSLIMIGSSNSPISWRVLFDYVDRRRWIKRIFPDIRVIGMPDAPNNDSMWFTMLDDYISSIFSNIKNREVIFYGGCSEDVDYFYSHNRKVKIVDRQEVKISGTNVREMLLQNISIENFVDKRILKEVKEIFDKQLKKLDELR